DQLLHLLDGARRGAAQDRSQDLLGEPEVERAAATPAGPNQPMDRSLELAHTRRELARHPLRHLEPPVVTPILRPGREDRETKHPLRRTDFGSQTGFEAALQPLFEIRDRPRRLIAGENDLLSRCVQRVEGVEELLLHSLLARKELDVVDDEDVELTNAS